MERFSWLVACLLLAACAQAVPPVVSTCPPVVQYSRDTQAALLEAEKQLRPDSPLIGAMIDYRLLRDELRACGK